SEMIQNKIYKSLLMNLKRIRQKFFEKKIKMKKEYFQRFISLFILLVLIVNVAARQAVWISGSNQLDQKGVYGTRGIASPNNCPGGRHQSISWIDSNNNLFL